MQLFVIRHAIAEDAELGQDDATRELTDDGRAKMKRVVRGLAELGVRFERVLASPWRRAADTAKLLASISDAAPITTSLLCAPPRAELLAQISEPAEGSARATIETAAVVGHEPWLSELVGWLAFGDTRHGEALVFKKAGVAWLEGTVVPGGMMVHALLPPRVLRTLA